MKEELLKPKTELKVSDLSVGDYFKSIEHNGSIYRVISNENGYWYILTENSIKNYEKYKDLKVVKVKPIKFENDTLYFEEV